jgi:hypothetical protein
MKLKQIWSIIDLLEKLVNGFPLVGGSTFEQVDKAQSGSRVSPPPPWHGLGPMGLHSSSATSPLVFSLSLLVQGTKPCGPLASSSSGSLPPPTKGGRGSRSSQGELLPSDRQKGGVEGRGS